jgi:endonuclease G, mitochondrial
MISFTILFCEILAVVTPTDIAKGQIGTSLTKYDHLKYNRFQLEYICEAKAAQRWTYTLNPKVDSPTDRASNFYIDGNYSRSCQQFSTVSYGRGYDRGHLVPSAHMDMTDFDRRQSNYMTNVLPQQASFNRGIWKQTETLTSCVRILRPITVYGGVIFDDPSNDFFLKSHGVKTPDYWWKVLVTTNDQGKEEVISWLFPNQENMHSLDSYLVSVKDIESRLNDGLGKIPIKVKLKTQKAGSRWTQRCSRTFQRIM